MFKPKNFLSSVFFYKRTKVQGYPRHSHTVSNSSYTFARKNLRLRRATLKGIGDRPQYFILPDAKS